MTEYDLDIAATIGRFRKEFGLTKTAVAQALGLRPTSYELERGNRTNNPGVKSIYKLAKAFGVSTDYLLGLTDDPTPRWRVDSAAAEVVQNDGGNSAAAAGNVGSVEDRLARIEAALRKNGIEV